MMKTIHDYIFEPAIEELFVLIMDWDQLTLFEHKFDRHCDIVKEIDKILKTD